MTLCRVLPLLALALACRTTAPSPTAPGEPDLTRGLRPVAVLQGEAWVQPGAELSGYTGWIGGIDEITYQAEPRPRALRQGGDDFPLDPRQERELRELFHEVLAEEMPGSLAEAPRPGPNVLAIEGRVVDLRVRNPGEPKRTADQTFIDRAGSLRLEVRVRDSVSGELLALTRHEKEFRSGSGRAFLYEDVGIVKRADVRIAFRRWARSLRGVLESTDAADASEGRASTPAL